MANSKTKAETTLTEFFNQITSINLDTINHEQEAELDTSDPEILGEYKIGKEIGRGSMAVVYEGFHLKTNERVAIKVISREISEASIQAEVTLCNRVEHCNIVKLYHIYQRNLNTCLVFEFVGPSLFDHIEKYGPFLESNGKKVFQQICTALQYLHRNRIVHRDIKLENILLDSNFHIKLIDLGLASSFGRDEKLTNFCGSAIYCSPEMLKRLPYGTATDIWSLGVVLFSLVTALIPWNASTEIEQVQLAVKGEYSFPDHLLPSYACQNLIERMLIVEPKKRIKINEVLEHPWLELSSSSLNFKDHTMRRTRSFSKILLHSTWRGKLTRRKTATKLFGVIDPAPIINAFN